MWTTRRRYKNNFMYGKAYRWYKSKVKPPCGASTTLTAVAMMRKQSITDAGDKNDMD
jgi:hypothetical protein